MKAPPRRRVLRGSLAAAAVILCAGEAVAQDASVRFTSEYDPRNFSQAAFLGSGIYSVDGRQIYIFRLSMGFPLRSEQEERWGLRLTLRPTVGFFDFKDGDEERFELPSSLGAASLLPGVEFRVPITGRWRLDPFVETGPAIEFEEDVTTWIYGLGVSSRAEFPLRDDKLLLWNKLLWAGNFESDVAETDDFALFETLLEWRVPLRGTLWGAPSDIAPRVKSELYLDALTIEPPVGKGEDVQARYEIGLTYGPSRKIKVWKLPVPRVGAAYRFGDGGQAIRVIFTSKF